VLYLVSIHTQYYGLTQPGFFGNSIVKIRISYDYLRELVERDIGMPVNVCLLWNKMTITTKAGYFERARFRKLTWLTKKSFRGAPSPRANGHTVTVNDIPKLIQHYVKRKDLIFGEYEIVPT
jgi:hypothetical protein